MVHANLERNFPFGRFCLPFAQTVDQPVSSCKWYTTTELEIISRLAPVKLSGQTYFCSDTTHFWPDKYPLRHISIKSPLPPHNVYISSKYIFYAFIVHAASNSMLERTVQPQSSAESILHLCIQLSLQFFVFYTVKF